MTHHHSYTYIIYMQMVFHMIHKKDPWVPFLPSRMQLTSWVLAQRRKLGSTSWREPWCIMGTWSSNRSRERNKQSQMALKVTGPEEESRGWFPTMMLMYGSHLYEISFFCSSKIIYLEFELFKAHCSCLKQVHSFHWDLECQIDTYSHHRSVPDF